MTFSQLRNQVGALCRKYATELELYRELGLHSAPCQMRGAGKADLLATIGRVPLVKQLWFHGSSARRPSIGWRGRGLPTFSPSTDSGSRR